jgi:hypothetical protein
MKINKLFLTGGILLSALAFNSTAHASPLVSIGDSATLHFVGKATVYSTSNVFRDETAEVDDIVLTLTPGLQLTSGTGTSNVSYGATARYEIRKYDDRNELDTELINLSAYGKYENARLVANASAAFFESQTNTGAANVVGALIESETTALNLNTEYRLSPKFKFGAGISYEEKDYLTFTNAVADYDLVRLPFDLFYELTPKLDLSAGYTYSDRSVEDRTGDLIDTSYDSEVHFFNVGLRGELMPKLTGNVKVGYRVREQSAVKDESTLGLDASLVWATTPKLSNTITLGRDFGVAGEGNATENTSFRLNSKYSISQQYFASAMLGYTMRDYLAFGREDDMIDFGLSLSYVPNEYWTISTGYTYSENDSNAVGNSYTDNRYELSASLKY